MNCLLLYDVTDDRKRAKIADACLDYGLDRIQYSAFTGDLTRNLQEELFVKLRTLLGKPGRLLLILSAPRIGSARRNNQGDVGIFAAEEDHVR